MRYEGDIYRPPGEWKSYLLQCTVGCSNNTCTFCSMYKSKRYHVRPLEDVLEDIQMAKSTWYRNTETVFLCDGDAINLPMDYLLTVLKALYEAFPHLRRVTTYAGPLSTLRKTPEELATIRKAGLQRTYLGVETGDDALLKHVHKGVGADGMLEAGQRLVAAGFDLWAIIITGLEGGGQEALERNARLTAQMINQMQPKHLSSMTLMAIEGTPLYREVQEGKLTLQTPFETLLETRELVRQIDLSGLHYTSNHASNYLPIKCTLKEDRDKVVAELDDIIAKEDRSRLRDESRRGL
jgi:radical SAM superfamily enzyme YgiQ (UPF0313 family)